MKPDMEMGDENGTHSSHLDSHTRFHMVGTRACPANLDGVNCQSPQMRREEIYLSWMNGKNKEEKKSNFRLCNKLNLKMLKSRSEDALVLLVKLVKLDCWDC